RPLPADALINEAKLLHGCGMKEVTSVKHNRMAEHLAYVIQVQLSELIPLGRYDQGVTAVRYRVHIVHKGCSWEDGPGFVHGFGIINAQQSAFFLQPLAQIDR